MEEWKNILNYEKEYKISNWGNIKNCKTNKMLSPFKNTNGYLQIDLYKNGKHKRFLLHKLVAEAFIPNTNKLPQINHIDENKTNNKVENLEWCTAKYNSNYGTRNNKLFTPVICIELNKKYNSINEASAELNIYKTSISHCCSDNKHYKSAGGYHWKYAKED